MGTEIDVVPVLPLCYSDTVVMSNNGIEKLKQINSKGNLTELKAQIHSSYLKILAIHRLITSHLFEKGWNVATTEQKEIVEKHIKELDKDAVGTWINNRLRQNNLIEEMTMTELREMGRDLSVKGYSTLTKLQLISAIICKTQTR